MQISPESTSKLGLRTRDSNAKKTKSKALRPSQGSCHPATRCPKPGHPTSWLPPLQSSLSHDVACTTETARTPTVKPTPETYSIEPKPIQSHCVLRCSMTYAPPNCSDRGICTACLAELFEITQSILIIDARD